MSLHLLGQSPKLCFGKPVFVRSSSSRKGSSSYCVQQTPPCLIITAVECEANLGKLAFSYTNKYKPIISEKKVALDLVENSRIKTKGSSNGWVATREGNGILSLQDDLNPFASHTDRKHIELPPFVTLPNCQTRYILNVEMSSSSPEEEDCIVAVKFFGPQLSYCRPAQKNPEWNNIYIEEPCFCGSYVVFFKKDNVFRMNGIGGYVIGSWDLRDNTRSHTPKLHYLRFQYQTLPDLTETQREILISCNKSVKLVESPSTGETFMVRWYMKIIRSFEEGITGMHTKALMAFKIDKQGNAVYTQDIGDLCIFLSRSRPFCVPASSFPCLLRPNTVHTLSFEEMGIFHLADCFSADYVRRSGFSVPFFVPPQNI